MQLSKGCTSVVQNTIAALFVENDKKQKNKLAVMLYQFGKTFCFFSKWRSEEELYPDALI